MAGKLLTYDEWKVLSAKDEGKPTRTYKDTVFRALFSDKKELLVLYNDIEAVHAVC